MIKILKLVTGEEVLGEVEEETFTKITLKNPCVLHMVPSRANPDQVGMALIPYASHAKDNKISVTMRSIIWEQEPVDELRNQYNSIFGNGIMIAKTLAQ